MKCPSCNEIAASFLRFSFTMQGVSFVQSMKGYFKCQHCGAVLRVTGYSRQMWFLMIAIVVILAAFVIGYRWLLPVVGIGATAAFWIALVLFIVSIFTFGLWKFARAGVVEGEGKSA